MKRAFVGIVLAAVALPALAANPYLTMPMLAELTAIDTVPSVDGINAKFATPAAAQAGLAAIAVDPGVDAGVRIRAIRTLAGYCPSGCGAGVVHDTLIQLIRGSVAPASGTELLLLRAAVESLGAARAVLPADVPTILPLLVHPSRDVRATVARSLRTTCSSQVLSAIISAQRSEQNAQVRNELSTAEEALAACITP